MCEWGDGRDDLHWIEKLVEEDLNEAVRMECHFGGGRDRISVQLLLTERMLNVLIGTGSKPWAEVCEDKKERAAMWSKWQRGRDWGPGQPVDGC